MTAISIDEFCDKFESYEGKFIKKEMLSGEDIAIYLDLYIQWLMLEETEEYNECKIDGIWDSKMVFKRLADYPSILAKAYFSVGNVDECIATLESKEDKENVDYLLLGLSFMLIDRYQTAAEIFKFGDLNQLSSIMNYFMGKIDKFTEKKFNDAAYLTTVFESLEVNVLQDKSLVLFSGDAEEGLLFRKCLAYFTKLIGSKEEICKLGNLSADKYKWTVELCELNNLSVN